MKIANKNTEPIIAKTTQDQTVIIENLKEHKTLLSSIFLFVSLTHLSSTYITSLSHKRTSQCAVIRISVKIT